MLIHGLSFLPSIDSYPVEVSALAKFELMRFFTYFYLIGGMWSFEDFRLALFLKNPVYLLIHYRLVSSYADEFAEESREAIIFHHLSE